MLVPSSAQLANSRRMATLIGTAVEVALGNWRTEGVDWEINGNFVGVDLIGPNERRLIAAQCGELAKNYYLKALRESGAMVQDK